MGSTPAERTIFQFILEFKVDRAHKYGTLRFVKTTLEIADATFQKAKVRAAEQGITLKELFNEALEEKLQKPKRHPRKVQPSWLRLEGAFGKTAAQRAETRRIQKEIDDEFERIDPED